VVADDRRGVEVKAKKAESVVMTEQYKRENAVCATIILKNPVAYPVGSEMERWARLVLA
jgi:hypothetical protein